jgi:predicted homoserine dehydrogenase-like protein
MLIVDKALEKRAAAGRPISVGMVGAGFMARGIALQIATAVPGMRLVAIANRTLVRAWRAFAEAGHREIQTVDSIGALHAAKARGIPAITEDWRLLCDSDEIDVILEVTGSIEYAAHVACTAIDRGKHVVLMNAELDGTAGPILKRRADAAGVVYSNTDGDQPGVIMNLYRFVRGIGVRPVLCGNIKGLHDPYRNPATQEAFARKWKQNPSMVTSFADGTKISFEQAIVANATGMRVGRRGMFGPTVPAGTPIEEASKMLPVHDCSNGPGSVDYIVGAVPSPGVFVLGTIEHPVQRHYLNLYKLGEGPLYCFYTPYHLCHFEVPTTIARAVLFGDAAIAPLGAPCVEVITAAKIDLKAGDVLDDIGQFKTYGLCENADVVRRERLLPMGIAGGCRLLRDVARDDVLKYGDVELPAGRLIDRLRAEQEEVFADCLSPSGYSPSLDAVADR